MPKTRTSSYWKGRFDQIEQNANNKSVSQIHDMEEKYAKAMQSIDAKVNAWYQRFANNNEVTMTEAKRMLNAKELKELKWNVEEYIKYGKENVVDQRWVRELENASAQFHINRLEALKLDTRQDVEVLMGGATDGIDSMLRNVYKDTFYRSSFEVQKGIGIGFDVGNVDDKMLSSILSKPWAVDGYNFSERLWGNKTKLVNTLHDELSRMVLTGKGPKEATENIKRVFNTSQNAANRVVMTEQAYFTTLSQNDSFKELGVEEYEIVETLDNTSCDECGEMDGQHFPLSEMEVGINAPPFHPYCRGTTCPYFEDLDGERVERDQDGNTYTVPSNMTYKEWKKAFVDGDKSGLKEVTSDPVTINKQLANNNSKIEILSKQAGDVHSQLENEMLFGSDTDKVISLQRQYESLTGEVEKLTADNESLKKLLQQYDVQSVQSLVVQGKNLVGDVDYSGTDLDFNIEKAVHAQGFDGVPNVVEYDDFKKAMEESNFYAERTYSAPTQGELDKWQNDLYNGKWYIDCSEGGAQYGQGMYCASSYDITNNKQMGGIGFEMSHYHQIGISKGNGFYNTEAITIQPDAKILELPNTAKAEEFISDAYRREYLKKYATSEQLSQIEKYIEYDLKIQGTTTKDSIDYIDTLYTKRAEATVGIESLIKDALTAMEDTTDGKKYHGLKNPGVLAAEMGYDVIKAEGHGDSGSYSVILNRTKVILCKGGSIYGN